ncbi:hypothetical protein BDY19DRAFT_152585 [Irpex rosettiformis]|uniref:Uncharacterized protein n=1 Tax=Irpex rosettiformis TaxID=378272 RepID=A0ACB8U3Q2_9APHY|nr:hypothetical protein BDY19DRAFT_152585 [Irpex rosettiformis]
MAEPTRGKTATRGDAEGLPQFTQNDIASMTIPQRFQVALQHSLMTGHFNDTKIWAFSRRHRSSGVIDKPLALYVNSTVLRANSEYFDGFFKVGFTEAEVTSLHDGFPTDKAICTSEYDYESDSDLDDEQLISEDDTEISDGHGGSTDMDSNKEPIFDMSAPKGAGEQSGRAIVIPDVAFTTIEALIYYLYTGTVSFAPLRSSPPVPETLLDEMVPETISLSVPQCSPKSMYRLADKYGIVALREQARLNIQSQLRDKNIVTELRSHITGIYDEIRNMEVEYASNLSRLPRILPAMTDWMMELATGNIPHSACALSAVFQEYVARRPLLEVDNRAQCGACGTRNLGINQPIFRFCSYCRTYRNPL